jgi:hypothetical protein
MAQQNRQFENSEQLYKSTSAKNAQVQTSVEYFDSVNKLANENQGNKAKKQTAVDWLEEQINLTFYVAEASEMNKRFESIYQQAKAMEKEQIMKGYFKGHCDGYNAGVSVYEQVEFQSAEQYYNETYNQ